MTFILVLLVSIGGFSNRESNATVSVSGFATEQECQAAGQKATRDLTSGTKKVRFTCLAQTKR